MTQYTFGAGYVIGRRTDLPYQPVAFFGTTQDWSFDIDQKLVTLLGQYKDPVDVAPSERLVTGKIKFARMQASTLGNMLLGVVPTANAGFDMVANEGHTATTTTFAVTNGSTFLEDLGLFYASSGIALSPVSATPSQGQYIPPTASPGVYTINSLDESIGINAFYQISTTSQYEIDVNNVLMGTGPTVELDFSVPYSVNGVAKKLNIQCYEARISKMTNAFKNTGYLVPEMDFTLFCNPAGNLFRWSMTE